MQLHVVVEPVHERGPLRELVGLVWFFLLATKCATAQLSTASFRERRWHYKDSYSSSSSTWSFSKIHSKLNECTTTKDDFFVIVDLR